MKNRKNTDRHLLSLLILSVGFVLCRYLLFSLHGMREWPALLFLAGMAVLLLSLLAKAKWFPFVTSMSYTAAFLAGALFQTNGTDPGGGSTNNLWIIWTCAFIGSIVLSAVTEWIVSVRKK